MRRIILLILVLNESLTFAQGSQSRIIDKLDEFYASGKDFLKDDGLEFHQGTFFSAGFEVLVLDQIEDNLFDLILYIKKDSNWIEKYQDRLDFGFLVKIELKDINFDNRHDIIIRTLSGRPYDILYLSSSNYSYVRKKDIVSVNFIEHYDTLIYSYKATGCADNIWESNLMAISNTSMIEIANIKANECDNENYSHQLVIKNSNGLKQIEVPTIETKRGGSLKDYWFFLIEQYLVNN